MQNTSKWKKTVKRPVPPPAAPADVIDLSATDDKQPPPKSKGKGIAVGIPVRKSLRLHA